MRHILRMLLITSVTFASCSDHAMENPVMLGDWSLVSYSITDTEIPFEGNDPKPNSLEDWLYARGREGFAELKPMTGMRLVIREDRSYAETKADADLRLLWFDSEGVQVDSPTPTSVICHVKSANVFVLHPVPAPSDGFRSRIQDRDALRYDDGDTLVCDQVRLEGGVLVRLISVATDELYLTRIIAVYEKSE